MELASTIALYFLIAVVAAIFSFFFSKGKRELQLSREKTQLQTIVESLSEGVLVIDRNEIVLLVNHALKHLFPEAALWQGRQILEGLSQVKLYEAIRKTLKDQEPRTIEMVLSRAKEERSVLVRVAPWLIRGKCHGVVMVFSEVTELRRLERHRREFVANVSHELKTPLTVIVGYAEMLSEEEHLPQQIHDYTLKLESNARHLKNLVDDILKLSQTESGKFSLKPRHIDLSKVVHEIVNRFEPWFHEKMLAVEIDVPIDLKIIADPTSLEQVISNLLSNAIRYNQKNSFVRIVAALEKGWIHLQVVDGGIGIAAENLPHVFERFYRVDKARSRELGGTGLGLAIVKHLMQLHGGKVSVQSRVGEGSTFVASFPRVDMG